MDGVPVKISEKYKPPKKISLPGSVLNKINVLKEIKGHDYDFSFERAVLEKIGKINTFKKSVQEKKKKVVEEQVKQIEEATEKLSVVSPDESPPSPSAAVTEPETVHYQIPPINTNIDILAPLPVSNTALSKEKCKVDNALLSEFESDTSSPFDNMELKSINDLQELADVLGTTNKTTVTKEEKVKPINGVTHQWKNSDQRNYGYPCQYYPQGVYSGQVVPSLYSTYPPHMMSADRTYQRNFMPDYPIHPVVTVPNSTYQPHSPSLSPPYISTVPPPLPPKPPSLSSNPTSSYSTYNSPAHSYKYSTPSPAIPPKIYQQQDSLAYCQPSPSRKEPEYQPPSPRLDPAEVSLWSDLQSTLQNRKTTNQQQEQKLLSKPVVNSYREVENLPEASESTLPNPLPKLNQDSQNLACRMSEMGFPLPRSARAVQLFNSDEAKVIEFLLQVQNFEDRHFPGDLVENALIVNNFNEDSALSYLDNVKKLTDFGFSEKQVVEALEKSNNDTDRALDFLIT